MKKKCLLAIACLLCIIKLQAQDFEFFINIENANETFTIPVNNFTYTYDYNVEIIRPLPEATIATYNNVTESLTHTFANPGLYLIKILEDSVFPAINFSVSPDRDKITNIASWGNNEWATMERAFENCTNLTLGANNTPNLTNVISTNKMFKNATSLTDARDKIGDWDMSNVQDMEQMFRDCTSFNEDISNWDTSNVQILHRIFQGATLFNQNLGNWDISNVTGTAAIFRDTALSTSNYDKILIGWGTLDSGETQIPTGLSIRADDAPYCTAEAIRTTLSNAPYNWVFTDAGLDCSTVANEDFFITTWETTTANESITIPTGGLGYGYYIDWGDGQMDNSVTGNITHTYTSAGTYTVRIGGLFPRIYFNETGDRLKIKSIEQWGTIVWRDMFNAFDGCENLTYNATDSPNLSNVIELSRMFNKCKNFNATNLNNWDVSSIRSVTFMFNEAEKFNGDISNWDVSNIIDFRNMFSSARDFNKDISGWTINTSEPVNMEGMFAGATDFNQLIGNWNISQVTDIGFMFQDALNFNQSLGNWDISNVTDMDGMLENTGLSIDSYDATLIGWATLDTGETQIPSGISLGANGLSFCQAYSAKSILENTSNNWTITDAGQDCSEVAFITTWETITDNESITIPTFSEYTYEYYVDWGDGTPVTFETGNATHTYATAGEYTVQIYGDFPSILFSNEGDKDKIKSIDQWGNIQWSNMFQAFLGASNLKILAIDAPDLSGVTNLGQMFANCTSLENPDLSNWDVSTITNMNFMFSETINFNGNITTWNVGNCTSFFGMFQGDTVFNQDLSNWNIGENTAQSSINMHSMFLLTNAFNQNLGNWDISNVTNMERILDHSGMSTENYDATLIGWATLDTGETEIPSNITLGATELFYCEAFNAKSILESDPYFWNITDAGSDCSEVAFITTWETINDNESITIPTTGSGYNYIVDWGDETPVTFETGNASHTYATAGEYIVQIYGDFPRIYFNNAGDKTKIVSIDQWGDNIWTTMGGAFRGCSNLTLEATDIPNLSQADDISSMFEDVTMFVDNGGEIGNWDVSNITKMVRTFQNSSFNSNINNWDVRNVDNMQNMFANATLFNQPLNHWELNKIIRLSGIFQGATNFNQDISVWNIDTARFMNTMFLNATNFNNDISSWNVSNVQAFQEMFWGATSFNQNLGDWDISQASNMRNMLNNSGMSTENYDATLIGWAANSNIPNGIELGALSLEYCAGETARDVLTGTVHNWMITGDNRFCGVRIAPKVYLQGAAINPFTGEESLMRDDLHRDNVIPVTSPYTDGIDLDPDIFSILDQDSVVDWVWVELRDANDHTQIVASKSALLQRDGDVVDAQYQTLSFENVSSGNYYVAIKHRNHLGILTTSAIALSETVTNLDLSADVNTVTGGALALRDMGNGIFAMYAGDTTGDGNILNTDISNAINASGGINIYSGTDANMDGNILNTDIQLIIQPNAGRIQQF